MKKILLILSILFLYSCEDFSNPLLNDFKYVSIWLEDTQDTNGYYHVEYDETNYHSVYFLTEANGRVYWDSPNTFDVWWQHQNFEVPIVNYSTYANENGSGQQLFYLDETMIGDTLMIFGYVDNSAWDYLYLILEDNE